MLVQFGKSMKLGFHEDFTNHTKVAVAVRPLLQDGKRASQFQVSIAAVSFRSRVTPGDHDAAAAVQGLDHFHQHGCDTHAAST